MCLFQQILRLREPVSRVAMQMAMHTSVNHHQSLCACVRAQSCPTVCDPRDCSPPGSSVHGVFPARIQDLVAISFSNPSLILIIPCSQHQLFSLSIFTQELIITTVTIILWPLYIPFSFTILSECLPQVQTFSRWENSTAGAIGRGKYP